MSLADIRVSLGNWAPSRTQLAGIYSRMNISTRVSLWIVVLVILVGLFPGQLAPYGPNEQIPEDSLEGPSLEHPLGTDLFGRDVLSRIIFGVRISLLVGTVAVGIAIAIGVPMGSLAGYIGGWFDEAVMRVIDMMMSLPSLVLALAIAAVLGASITNVIVVIAIAYSPSYARLIRGSVLSVKEEDYIKAAESTGLGQLSILVKHILPNAMTPVLVQATYHVATAIIFEASLSFLGLGVQPPTATLGAMISNGRGFLPEEWWISTFPGLLIMVTVIAFNILGDGLRDEFDPRSVTQAEGGM